MHNRGIYDAAIDRFHLGYTGDNGNPKTQHRLAIPYETPAGPWFIKYRCVGDHDCKELRHGKYVNDDGNELQLYNAQTLLTADRAVIVEGELDAIAVEMAGVPAVAYPGSSAWHDNKHWRWTCDSLSEVVVVCDGDDPAKHPKNNGKQPGDRGWVEVGIGEESGRQVANLLRSSLPDLDVRVVVMPVGFDSNRFIHERGDLEFLEEIGLI